MESKIITNITCPITQQIFRYPITLSDGHTYEYEAIKNWLSTHKTSPITKQNIKLTHHNINYTIKSIINEMLETNVIEENMLYPDYKINIINKKKIANFAHNNDYEYNNFCYDRYFGINSSYSLNEQKDILDEIDFECIDNKGFRPIHYICRYSNPELIKYIIDKDIDLECVANDGWKPIHFICFYSTPEMIKYIIDKGVDLECATNLGMKPIHYICQYSNPEMIKYIIEKGVDLEYATNDGLKPIHFICHYSTLEIVRYIISKGISLQVETVGGLKPICSATYNKNMDIFNFLFENYFNFNEKNKSYYFVLNFIREKKLTHLKKFFLDELNYFGDWNYYCCCYIFCW